MYTWKGTHYVGYIKYLIVRLHIKKLTSTDTELSCIGTIKLVDRARRPVKICSWEANGIRQPDSQPAWTINCTDEKPDCWEKSGVPAFTVACDTNDDIQLFIQDHLSKALTPHN